MGEGVRGRGKKSTNILYMTSTGKSCMNSKIQNIKEKAEREVEKLSGKYVRARPEDREAIQAGIQVERELAEGCDLISD